MNKRPTPDQIRAFRFEAKRCKGHDKDFMRLVGNALLESIDPTTLYNMRTDLYAGINFEWVKRILEEHQNTFAIGSEVI